MPPSLLPWQQMAGPPFRIKDSRQNRPHYIPIPIQARSRGGGPGFRKMKKKRKNAIIIMSFNCMCHFFLVYTWCHFFQAIFSCDNFSGAIFSYTHCMHARRKTVMSPPHADTWQILIYFLSNTRAVHISVIRPVDHSGPCLS